MLFTRLEDARLAASQSQAHHYTSGPPPTTAPPTAPLPLPISAAIPASCPGCAAPILVPRAFQRVLLRRPHLTSPSVTSLLTRSYLAFGVRRFTSFKNSPPSAMSPFQAAYLAAPHNIGFWRSIVANINKVHKSSKGLFVDIVSLGRSHTGFSHGPRNKAFSGFERSATQPV